MRKVIEDSSAFYALKPKNSEDVVVNEIDIIPMKYVVLPSDFFTTQELEEAESLLHKLGDGYEIIDVTQENIITFMW
jgi:hypothetical protein